MRIIINYHDEQSIYMQKVNLPVSMVRELVHAWNVYGKFIEEKMPELKEFELNLS